MRPLILCALVACAAAAAVAAQADHVADLRAAEKLYQENRFPEAVTAYEALLPSGRASAALWYNLGNAYYRAGRIGRARASFEEAARIAPRDADIRHNNAIVRRLAGEPEPGLSAMISGYLLGLASLNELVVATLSGFSGLCVMGGSFLLWRRRRYAWIAGALLMWTIFLGGWAAWKFADESWGARAIIIDGTAEARTGPGVENPVSFTIPEGRQVVISGGQDGWSAVTLPKEKLTGWIETGKLSDLR